MRSARQQSEIDSRSALTYSRNTGMNVLITAAQKLSALWMKTARVASVLLLCPRPSLTRLWLSGIWLVSSSHRWPPRTTTGQHNFSGNYTHWRCFIRSYKFIFQALWVFTNSNSFEKVFFCPLLIQCEPSFWFLACATRVFPPEFRSPSLFKACPWSFT